MVNITIESQVSTTIILVNMPLIISIFHTLLSNNEHKPGTQTSPNPSSFKASTLFTCHNCHPLLIT